MSTLGPPTAPASSPDGRPHVPALDGIRGLAILMVMFFHMTVMPLTTPLDRAWAGLASFSASGVDLFFVLSGFLITGILYDAKGGPHYFRNFYLRRALRIFPLYYAVVFVSLVLLPRIHHPKADSFGRIGGDGVWYWLYLSNLSTAYRGAWRHGILDVAWSLSIEEQFYLVWPLLVFLCRRKTLMGVCLAVACLGPITRAALVAAGVGVIPIVTLTPAHLDGLAVGAAIALLARGPAGVRPLLRPAPYVAAASLVYLLWTHRAPETWDTTRSAQIFAYTANALLFGSILVMTLGRPTDGRWARGFSQRWLGVFGQYSYALYLFHLPIRAAVRDLAYGPARFPALLGSRLPGQLLFYGLSTAASLAAAWVSWHAYEKQFLKLKRLFPMGTHETQRVDPTQSNV